MSIVTNFTMRQTGKTFMEYDTQSSKLPIQYMHASTQLATHKVTISADTFWVSMEMPSLDISQNGVIETTFCGATVAVTQEAFISQIPCLPYSVFSAIASAIVVFGLATSSLITVGSGLVLFATLGAAYWESRR